MSNIIDKIQLSGTVYTIQGSGGGGTVSSAITSGDTNAVAGGAVYDKFDEVEQVTARALNSLSEADEVTARALVDLDERKQDVLSAGTGIQISGNVISTTSGSGTIDSAITSGSSNAVESSAIWSATTYNRKQIELKYDDIDYSTNFPSGCTKIDVDVTNFQQYVTRTINFYNGNNRLGNINITKTYNGSINVSNGFTDSTYTISGNTVTVTWPEEKNVTKLQVNASASVYAIIDGVFVNEHSYMDIEVDEKLAKKLDSSAYTPIYVDSELNNASTNPLQNKVLYDELRYVSGKSQNVNVTFDATNYSTNFPSGCTKIDVDVTNFQQYVSGNITFYNGNNRLGGISITKTYNAIDVSNSFTDSTYTISGNTVTVTWLEEKNVTKLQVNGSATSVYAYGGNIYIPLIQQVSANTAAISGIEVSSAITSGDTNAVAGGAVYDKFDEVEQVTARALNQLSEADEVTARALNDLNTKIEEYSGGGITSGEVQTMIDESISGKVNTSSVVSSVTSASTDSEIPTAKAVYDAIPTGGSKAIEGGRGITVTSGETADTVSFNLPISAGTGTNSIIGGDPHNTATNIGSIALGGWYNNDYSYGLCNASGKGAVSLGGSASGEDSFTAAGNGSAEGKRSAVIASYLSKAKGTESFAIGRYTTANTLDSFAQGKYTKTTNEAEVALGEYNNSVSATTTFGDSGNTLFSVGNGTSDNARHNAFEIRQNGDIYISSGGTDIKLQDNLGGGGGGSVTIDPTLDSGSTNPVANSAITTAINAKADTTAVTQAISEAVSGKADTTAVTQAISEAVSGKADTSAVTAVQDSLSGKADTSAVTSVQDSLSGKADTSAVTSVQDSLSGYVTTNTEQTISGRKIFTYSATSGKAIEFKQTSPSNKVGFRVRTSAEINNELASFEFRPNTFTVDGVQHPLLYFGHYRSTATANAGVPQTVIGFRQYDQLNAAAYHYLMPLPEKAKTPFSLTTSFKNFFATLGFKNGSTMITTDNTGVADFSSVLGGLKLQKLTQVEYDALTTKDDNTVYFIGDSTNGYTMKIGSANVN